MLSHENHLIFVYVDYLDRFTKMQILSLQTSGDEFFLLDGEFSFWNTMENATAGFYLRRLANAEHSCAGHEISLFLTMRSFYLSVYDVSYMNIFP